MPYYRNFHVLLAAFTVFLAEMVDTFSPAVANGAGRREKNETGLYLAEILTLLHHQTLQERETTLFFPRQRLAFSAVVAAAALAHGERSGRNSLRDSSTVISSPEP